MIIFEKIIIKNFFSVGNIPITIDLNTHKKTLCVGKNGSGKSSIILDSIVYALYGKPFRKINKPNVINSINKSDMLLELYFSIGNKKYKILRGIKPNIFEIYCNDELIDQESKAKDYQDYLEKYIIKANYKSFVSVVILGNARYTPFMLLPAADRRSITEDLLDIQIFSLMNVILKNKISALKEADSELKYSMDVLGEKIKLQKKIIKDNKIDTNKKIEEIKNEIEISKAQIEKYESDNGLINRHVDVMNRKILDFDNVKKQKEKFVILKDKIVSTIKIHKKELKFYDEHDNCSVCKQPIDDEFKMAKIDHSTKKLSDLDTGLIDLEAQLATIDSRLKSIHDIQNDIVEHQKEVIKNNSSITALQEYINKKNIEINELLSVSKSNVTEDDLTLFIEELKVLMSKKSALDEKKKYYDYVFTLLKDGGIKTKIVKQYLPILNKLINTYLAQMNFFVNFNINENFEEVIKSRHRDEFKIESFSEGEKTRIDLAILFAFRKIAQMKNSVNTNLLIMDEILDSSLDKESVEVLIDMLNTLDGNIIIISHKDEQISDYFDRIIKFEKVKNFTKIKGVV